VGGVLAYSTLGWFDDPLLSTFIHDPDWQLARLLFHELAHQVAYAKGDATFNEPFAAVVEEEGVRRWLAAEGRPGEAEAFRAFQARRREFAARVQQLREVHAMPNNACALRVVAAASASGVSPRARATARRMWGRCAGSLRRAFGCGCRSRGVR